MQQLTFISGNLKKVEYLRLFYEGEIDHKALDLEEIQSLNITEVVTDKAKRAYDALQTTVLIEDTSLTFTAMGKLPGTFIKWYLQELGNDGLCTLLEGFSDRSATAEVMYGLYDGENLQVFNARVPGKIVKKPIGERGMGWDPIFIPDGANKTYAEMSEKELFTFSVRRKAVEKLSLYLKSLL